MRSSGVVSLWVLPENMERQRSGWRVMLHEELMRRELAVAECGWIMIMEVEIISRIEVKDVKKMVFLWLPESMVRDGGGNGEEML